MVTPLNGTQRPLYEGARDVLRLTLADLAATEIGTDGTGSDEYALHPALADFKTLYDDTHLAVIVGVGYPNPNLSHFRSEDIWWGADPVGFGVQGWIGKHLDALAPPVEQALCVTTKDSVIPLLRTYEATVLAINRLKDFVYPTDPLHPEDAGAVRAALDAVHEAEVAAADPLGRAAAVGIGTTANIDAYPHDTNFSSPLDAISGRLARDLKTVTAIIQAGLPARFFHVRIGGFDTHASQGAATGAHANLLQRTAGAIRAFLEGLDTTTRSRTVVHTLSEFGRRKDENGSDGTDHGTLSPMFVAGDPVVGGVYGVYPDLADVDGNGNLDFDVTGGRTIDFRDYFGTLLKGWLGVADPTTILPTTAGWTAFTDLGFLP
jgi:uncharacterized protein (DUF1501 family)